MKGIDEVKGVEQTKHSKKKIKAEGSPSGRIDF